MVWSFSLVLVNNLIVFSQ